MAQYRKEHDANPDWDAKDANELYSVLEKEIIPNFYKRDARGIPHAWVERMRASMAELTAQFSTNRILREYIEALYLPALQLFQDRIADKCQKAIKVSRWRELIQKEWENLHFGQLEIETLPGFYKFQVPVYLGNLNTEVISVQICADPVNGNEPEIQECIRGQKLAEGINAYNYSVRIPARRHVNLQNINNYLIF